MIRGIDIHYYIYCKRKLWLSKQNISFEHTNEHVKLGKLIEENTFDRRSQKNKQVQIGSIKIDYVDKKNKVLHETKKSSKNIETAIWQMKYYLYLIRSGYTGMIEIPKEKKKEVVVLSDDDILLVDTMISEIGELLTKPIPQKLKNIRMCKNCSFYEFCFS